MDESGKCGKSFGGKLLQAALFYTVGLVSVRRVDEHLLGLEEHLLKANFPKQSP